MQDQNEDTEWNDILRAKGIIPEKPKENEITEDEIMAIMDKAIKDKSGGKPNTLDSGIDVGQRINVGPGNFGKNNKRRALNKCRAWNKMWQLRLKKPTKFENVHSPWKKFQNLINVWPLIRL